MGRRTKTCRAQFTQGRKRAQLLFLLLCTALIFVACKKGGTTQVEAASENSVLTAAGDEDLKAGGTAVILQVDENRQKIKSHGRTFKIRGIAGRKINLIVGKTRFLQIHLGIFKNSAN